MKLDFVNVGPQRTASSWLDERLRPHPQIVLPGDVKETMFFDDRFEKGWDWYWSHYESPAERQILGECGPSYFDETAARIRLVKAFPDLKIIINVRNPILRTFSLFRHHLSRGRVADDFFRAIEQYPRIITSGRYAEIIPDWEESFGAEQVLLLLQNNLKEEAQDSIDQVCEFLGIDQLPLEEEDARAVNQSTIPRFPILARAGSKVAVFMRDKKLNRSVEFLKKAGLHRLYKGKSSSSVKMNQEVFDYLLELHGPDITYLEKKLDRDLSEWRQFQG